MQPLESRPQAARILAFRKFKRIYRLHLNRVPFTYYPELQRAIERRLGIPPDPSIRVGVVKDSGGKPAGGPNLPQAGRPNGHSPGASRAPETGVDAFRRAFTRSRREALAEYEDEPEIAQLLEDVLERVRTALGT